MAGLAALDGMGNTGGDNDEVAGFNVNRRTFMGIEVVDDQQEFTTDEVKEFFLGAVVVITANRTDGKIQKREVLNTFGSVVEVGELALRQHESLKSRRIRSGRRRNHGQAELNHLA